MSTDKVMKIIEKYRGKPGGLISMFQNIQLLYGYLPEHALKIVSERTGRSLADLYGVASFHNIFNLTPGGQSLLEPTEFAGTRSYSLDVRCPHCNHGLTDKFLLLDDLPAIFLTVSFGAEHGWFCFSCWFDTYNIKSEHPLPLEGDVNFFCPHCNAEFVSADTCSKCSAPMVPMLTLGGMVTQICSRTTCKNHLSKLGKDVTARVPLKIKVKG